MYFSCHWIKSICCDFVAETCSLLVLQSYRDFLQLIFSQGRLSFLNRQFESSAKITILTSAREVIEINQEKNYAPRKEPCKTDMSSRFEPITQARGKPLVPGFSSLVNRIEWSTLSYAFLTTENTRPHKIAHY